MVTGIAGHSLVIVPLTLVWLLVHACKGKFLLHFNLFSQLADSYMLKADCMLRRKKITENNHVLSEVSVQSGKAAEPRESGSQSLLGCLFSVQCRMDSVIQYMK